MARRRSRNYSGLTDREIEVLASRFYLDMTLEAIAKGLPRTNGGVGVTKERVRQIEARALKKLRRKPEEFW